MGASLSRPRGRGVGRTSAGTAPWYKESGGWIAGESRRPRHRGQPGDRSRHRGALRQGGRAGAGRLPGPRGRQGGRRGARRPLPSRARGPQEPPLHRGAGESGLAGPGSPGHLGQQRRRPPGHGRPPLRHGRGGPDRHPAGKRHRRVPRDPGRPPAPASLRLPPGDQRLLGLGEPLCHPGERRGDGRPGLPDLEGRPERLHGHARGRAPERTPEEAARGALALALFPDDGPSGRFFRDAEEIRF